MSTLPIQIELPNDFLQEEIRCNHLITSTMKKVWAVQLDLLNKFDYVCKQNGISYYACAGTLLGAMRHSGYIPWDDDVDVMLYREDYDKLCGIAANFFNEPYFFQTENSDPGSIRGHAQLRNSNTTAIVEAEQNGTYPFNQGIFIDIFALDNIPDERSERSKYIKKAKQLKKLFTFKRDITWGINHSTGFVGIVKSMIIHTKKLLKLPLVQKKPNRAYFEWEKHIKQYISIKTEWVMIMALNNERFCWKRDWICEPKYLTYEFLHVPIPKYYDEVLSKTYKDWHKMRKDKSGHGGVIYDPEHSYKNRGYSPD